MSKATIIGSGIVGRCWAALFARAGYSVSIFDISPDQLEMALTASKAMLQELSDNGLLRDQDVDVVHARISASSNLEEALSGSQYVQECVPENIDLKRKVFTQLCELVGDDTILASSTSCLPPSEISKDLSRKTQVIVAHPVNPPHYIPVVEVVQSPWTRPDIIERTRQVLLDLGQAPVLLKKEVNGFIINRLQYALLMEAWRLVEDGVASPEDVDTAVSQGLGLRWSFMGPFETIDLNAPGGVSDYCERYGENITETCREMADARDMKSTPTAQAIHEAMRASVPAASLASGERRAWRDKRLAALAVHKNMMAAADKK